MEPKYLTEARLIELMSMIFPNVDIITNKIVPLSGIKLRPDIRIENYKLIVEFDGYRHYNQNCVQIRDLIKDKLFNEMGYKVIHIPYFVQASIEVIKTIFGSDTYSLPENLLTILKDYQYPHGFIDKNALLPIDYNELGIEMFKSDIKRFWYIGFDIIESLEKNEKCSGVSNIPMNLEFLMDAKIRGNLKIIRMCDPEYDLTPEEKENKEQVDKAIEKEEKRSIRQKKLERIIKESGESSQNGKSN